MPGPEQTAPQAFGPYQLISRLGRGGMGETWRAVRESHSGVTKELVIKRILRAHSANERFRQNFVNEARLSARLSHGNVCQVFDFGEVEGEFYMAMEYVHGRPLSLVLERGEELGLPVLPIPLATFIAIEMLKGLAHAHQRTDEKGRPLDIVHRDISPDNVMISYEGEVKILDFGIARARLEGRAETLPGIVKGKLMFLSPEQAAAKPLDGRSDVWATGLVLYRMLSGKLAADHYDGARVLYELTKGNFRPLTEAAPWVPTVLGDAVAKSLKVNLDERYPSAKAFAHELQLYLHRAAPATSESQLSGLMASLFSREQFDEGREATIAPEVHAMIAEVRRLVEKPSAQHIQTRPAVPAIPRQETTGELDTVRPGTRLVPPKPVVTPGPKVEVDVNETMPLPDLATPGPIPEPVRAAAPTVTGPIPIEKKGIPRWFLVVCGVLGAAVVGYVALSKPEPAPAPPQLDTGPRAIAPNLAEPPDDPDIPAWKKLENEKASAEEQVRKAELGYLTLTTVNPSAAKALLDGQPFGQTPLIKVPMESGNHLLKVIDEQGKQRDLSVEVAPGKVEEMLGINVGTLPLSK